MSTSVPILMYHQVTPYPAPQFRRYTVTHDAFAAQMNWLAFTGYQTITPDDLYFARKDQGHLPKRPVLITFDDGYQDCAEYAVPAMLEHDFTAVFYVVAGLLGQTSRWLIPELGCDFALFTWDTARRLQKSGFYFGAHSVSHPRLARIPASACRAELQDARRRTEDELGHEIHHLAYPYGSYDDRVQRIAADSGYVSACSTRKGLSAADDDLLALHRVPVFGHDTIVDFICRLHGRRATPTEWIWAQKQGLQEWFESFQGPSA